MNILSIETSTKTVSVAFIDGSSLLVERVLNQGHPSGGLLKIIDSTLKECKKTINDVELFVVDIGPGSFTGIRVGLSTALGFSYALSKPVVGVRSFEVLANSVLSGLPVVVWIDTHQGMVYQAILQQKRKGLAAGSEQNGGIFQTLPVEYLSPPQTGNPEGLLGGVVNMVKQGEKIKEGLVFVGDGAIKFRNLIRERFANQAILPECSFSAPSAGVLGMIGFRKFVEKGAGPEPLHPYYLNDFSIDKKLT